jgi:hypothetical protein
MTDPTETIEDKDIDLLLGQRSDDPNLYGAQLIVHNLRYDELEHLTRVLYDTLSGLYPNSSMFSVNDTFGETN